MAIWSPSAHAHTGNSGSDPNQIGSARPGESLHVRGEIGTKEENGPGMPSMGLPVLRFKALRGSGGPRDHERGVISQGRKRVAGQH